MSAAPHGGGVRRITAIRIHSMLWEKSIPVNILLFLMGRSKTVHSKRQPQYYHASMSVSRYIRFVDQSNEVHYGEISDELLSSTLVGTEVPILAGLPLEGLKITGRKAVVQKMSPAKVPIMFTKPADAVVGPYDDISIHPCAQSELDYEAELCVIIGKDAKNVREEEALDYVHGYTAGNDLSARKYQTPEWSGNQFCYAKSFDGFAPMGPSVATTTAIPDPQNINFWLKVNGNSRQQSNTAEMIFSVRQIIVHLSQGTTLRKGTIIMTGTPAGVGIFHEPKGAGYLKHGDVIDIQFEGIGLMTSKFVFES
ncbi:unnamed protein product [Sphagnum balticum]